MIPHDIKNIPGQRKHQDAVREYLVARALTEPLFITEMLMENEPDRTMMFMSIDGHVLNGGSPQVDPSTQIDMPNVRLMTVEENQVIKVKSRERERIPGTDRSRLVPKHTPVGNDVTLTHAKARDLLYKFGYPYLDHRTRGGKKGFIVEVAWLESEVKKADCLPELIDLWEKNILPRINKGGAAPKSADDASKTKGKVS